ncbi:hypothetical protein M406DRAFT_74156 [Cryphonectria parasitica EP155]|uniref:Uncharacterized protein n=1 Tax=Cryphonectria parasitica (strain ATCC 38755 / EP155) TaxID=660469 RepID=A0A9P4XYA5_CRYP1|nr:uncharacterized protein M406DRAFT_74156 [Cryphonectria parasitica EP155]KAF3763567.1 hypothetical protein M406DRAFT_74156 [Cryphonectria parasitica EP155]
MDEPGITLSTKGKASFNFHDGYDDVATQELEELLRLSREMLVSMETELTRRKISVLETLPGPVKTCVLQRLDDPANLATSAAQILKSETTDRRDKIYKRFLQDVLEQCGGGIVVLCSSSLGKRRIVELKNMERISLLGYLKSNRNTFEHAILDDAALTLGITCATQCSMSEPHRPEDGLDATLPTANPVSIERREQHGPFGDGSLADSKIEIEYKYSEAHIDAITVLGPDLASALQASKQRAYIS